MTFSKADIPNPIIPMAALSLVLYYVLSYTLKRTEVIALAGTYALLFFLFSLLYQQGKNHFKAVVIVGILFRVLLLFALPELSQDFYRFIWDGELLIRGIDPYLETPDNLFDRMSAVMPLAQTLYEGMGSLSASHYSNYPPLNQVFFAIAAFLGGPTLMGKVIVLKAIILLGDLLILRFGTLLLKLLHQPRSLILLYFLNPFTIIELSGNLHFEGVMMGCFLGGLWFLFQKRYLIAAPFIAAAITIKLIPLLFLPLLFTHITGGTWRPGTRRSLEAMLFTGSILLLTALSFMPFTSLTNLDHFVASVNLWFSRFEFNASLYYLAREVGYWIKGYNTIGSIAPWIPIVTFFSVMGLSIHKDISRPNGLITVMVWAICIYLFISTTVHPWYLATPLVLSVLINKKFALVWTALVILSYAAYANAGYAELPVLLWVEYGVTFAVFYWEMIRNKEIKAF